ncbi:TetR/AcrR family transcriptional regulator [Anaerosporobacter faecicola]|uniref:TetR/AcrR family transcriptional regulator n=1 Tax=Anaerosporobacter faecicola TaxID=2718714 RepID=UPI00143B6D09|nr:TetR/AcrR family transcriptional regulator [Anaerosporobacter faecicola]
MQVLKEELQVMIVESAKHEFYIHGFKATSMRTIAKKANTTIGNLYNYFANKEELFLAVVGELPTLLKQALYGHQDAFEEAQNTELNFREIVLAMEEQLPQAFFLQHLLSQEFIILMEGAEGTSLEGFRDEFLGFCIEHMQEHMPGEENALLAAEIANSFVSVLIYVAKHKKSLEEGIRAITRYIEILIAGIMEVNDTMTTND